MLNGIDQIALTPDLLQNKGDIILQILWFILINLMHLIKTHASSKWGLI